MKQKKKLKKMKMNYQIIYLLDAGTKVSRILNDLKYKKHALHDIIVLESKLIKLEISPERIDIIKNSVL